MLPKNHRLNKRGSFSYVYAHGAKVNGAALTMRFVSSSSGAVRIGFSVNNKIGHAVTRNLVKRRMRAIAAEVIPSLGGCQVVFIARRGAGELSYDELKASMLACFEKSGLLRKR